MANVAKALADQLATLGVGVVGSDIFVGESPASNTSLNGVYWVIRRSQSPTTTNVGKLFRDVFLDIFYQDADQERVHERLEALETLLNGCPDLPPFVCRELEIVNHFVAEDISNEEHWYGAITVRATLII